MKTVNLFLLNFILSLLLFAIPSQADQSLFLNLHSSALRSLIGTFELEESSLSKTAQSQEDAICYPRIKVEIPDEKLKTVEFQIFGHDGNGNHVVVQVMGINQGLRQTVIENPMFPGILGVDESYASAQAGKLYFRYVSRNLTGFIQFLTEISVLKNTDGLEFWLRDYRAINGYKNTFAFCKYKRLD